MIGQAGAVPSQAHSWTNPISASRIAPSRWIFCSMSSSFAVASARTLVVRLGSYLLKLNQFHDLGQREAQLLCSLDEADQLDGVGLVLAIAGVTPSSLGEKPTSLVVAQGLNVHSGIHRDLADLHRYRLLCFYSMNMGPVPRYRVKGAVKLGRGAEHGHEACWKPPAYRFGG